MLKRALWGLLLSLAVLLISGAALSSNHQHFVLTVMDFDTDTGVLVGYPNGAIPPGWYKHTDKTRHLIGIPPHQFPPNPCRPIANVWYRLARQDDAEVRHAQTFRIMVALMARFQCNADVVTDPTVDPPLVISINPRP
jgi:hypothetical protein